jgi:hypothetical protein
MEFWNDMPRLFPLIRGGGVFLALVGLGILVGAVGGRTWLIPSLIAGAALGVIAMAVGGITKWIFAGIGYPSIWHWLILGVAFLVEGFLVSQVVDRIPDRTSRAFWLWMLFVVGVHFLLLTFSHGPICGLLGLVCMANAYVGLRLKDAPYRVFWGLDGVLKIVAGVTMVLISFGS